MSADTFLARLLDLVRQQGCTLHPVYEGDFDHIVGVVHIKELLLRGDNLQQPVKEAAYRAACG